MTVISDHLQCFWWSHQHASLMLFAFAVSVSQFLRTQNTQVVHLHSLSVQINLPMFICRHMDSHKSIVVHTISANQTLKSLLGILYRCQHNESNSQLHSPHQLTVHCYSNLHQSDIGFSNLINQKVFPGLVEFSTTLVTRTVPIGTVHSQKIMTDI